MHILRFLDKLSQPKLRSCLWEDYATVQGVLKTMSQMWVVSY